LTIFSRLKKIEVIEIIIDNLKNVYFKYLISDKKLLKKRFKQRLGRDIKLNNPQLYNDKLQWLKLYWYTPVATQCADKYEVREFITKKTGGKYLNELLGVYDSVNEINIDELPESFVLKGTHGSGYNIICKDKSQMDWDKEFRKMRRWMRQNYYWSKREWVYRDIQPRIICEKYIYQEEEKELRDYRFFCFNGEPKFITVDLSINEKSKTRRNLYDLEWNLMDEEITYPKDTSVEIERPTKLDEMIQLSKLISESFPHARVDFYQIRNEVIFGEITFFHQSGMGEFRPLDFEKRAGEWLKLPTQ